MIYNFILYKNKILNISLLKNNLLNINLYSYIFKDSKCFTSSKNF